MKVFLVIFVFFILSEALGWKYRTHWRKFKKQFGKKFKTKAHERDRMRVFEAVMHEIDVHNNLYKHGTVFFEMGLNEDSDIPYSQLMRFRNGRRPPTLAPVGRSFENETDLVRGSLKPLPNRLDWASRGKVTRVKNQGKCGSCYSFATAAAIESSLLIHRNQRVELSAQQAVDCSRRFGNAGCNGGLETNVYRYLLRSGGLNTWGAYPYRGRRGKCRVKQRAKKFKIKGFKSYRYVSERFLKYLLNNVGPVSVAMDASGRAFMHYKSGIYKARQCGKRYNQLNHAVLLVGYGTQNGINYWKLKNSWGRSWGMGGYFKIARRGNMCGIRTDVSYPRLE